MNGMSGCENLHIIDDVISYITTDNAINIPVFPDYSGKRVNSYYNVIKICYGLMQQRQFLSRNDTEFEYIDRESCSQVQPLIGMLHSNRSNTGLYNRARILQKKEVIKWFGDKPKVEICFLPTSKEDETTNLGCATVFLEILENAGLINIKRKKWC